MTWRERFETRRTQLSAGIAPAIAAERSTELLCREVLGALWELATEHGHLPILLDVISKREKVELRVKRRTTE